MKADSTLWVLLIFECLLLSFARSCSFPFEWRGEWYQSDFKMIVSEHTMSSPSNVKGRCHRRDGYKILLRQESKNCYRCVVFTPRHANLLQYKRSDCIDEDSLSLCSTISGDSVLYTLLRLPSRPVKCPFEGPYTFTYADGVIPCKDTSTLEACADDSKFRITYKGCGRGSDEQYDFHCLATWQSGNSYLYAKRVGPTIKQQSDMYRCFVHSKFGQTGIMSRSVDPSCRLVGGPDEGDFKLSFVKDNSRWPKSGCSFPHFTVKHEKWRDLSGKYLLRVDNDHKTVRLQKRVIADGVKRYDEAYPVSLSAFKCLSTSSYESRSSRSMVYQTFVTTDDCVSHYQCIRLEKKSTGVIDLFIGKSINKLTKKCSSRHFVNSTKYVFIPADIVPTSCPKPGTYRFTEGSCGGTINIGCDNTDEMVIETKCPDQRTKVDILRCLEVWGAPSHSKKHVIVDQPGDSSMAATCVTFDVKHAKLTIATSHVCTPKVSHPVLGRDLEYRLSLPKEMCEVSPKSITKSYESRFNRPDGRGDYSSPGGTGHNLTSSIVNLLLLVVYQVVVR